MKNAWNRIRWIVMTVLGSIIFGAAYAILLGPSGLNAGGISGLSAVIVKILELVNLQEKIPFLTVGVLTIVINLPLFAIAGIRIGKRFFFGSLLGMMLSSYVMDNLNFIIEVDPLLAAIYGGVLAGFGVGIVFLAGASTGGADIVVRLVKLKAKNMNIGQIAISFDIVVVALTGIVFRDVANALYTGIAVFLVGKVMDAVVYGFDNSKVAMIISSEYEIIATVVGEKLGRGATYLYSQGTYSKIDSKVVLIAVHPKQIAELKELVVGIDPNAFIILQEAHQVLGDGFIRHTKDSL